MIHSGFERLQRAMAKKAASEEAAFCVPLWRTLPTSARFSRGILHDVLESLRFNSHSCPTMLNTTRTNLVNTSPTCRSHIFLICTTLVAIGVVTGCTKTQYAVVRPQSVPVDWNIKMERSPGIMRCTIDDKAVIEASISIAAANRVTSEFGVMMVEDTTRHIDETITYQGKAVRMLGYCEMVDAGLQGWQFYYEISIYVEGEKVAVFDFDKQFDTRKKNPGYWSRIGVDE